MFTRFGIRSTETGFIANSYDIASFIFLLPVSYLGGRGTGTKPVWISAGLTVMGLGSLLFSLPHFSADKFNSGEENSVYCNSSSVSERPLEVETSQNKFKFVFMASQFLHGAGAAPLYTLGVTYIDENIGPASSASFLSIFYTMAIVGPAVGYGMGGQLLSIHTDFSAGMTSDDPDWVGAWWMGFLICGILSLIIAAPIALLPASLPGMREPSGEQTCRSRINSRTSSFRSSIKSKPPAAEISARLVENELAAANGPLPMGKELLDGMIILITNPTFICICLAGASEGFLMQGLATFLPKMMQSQFNLTASQSAMYVGAVSVVAGGGGTLLGGMAVKRLGLKVQGLLKMTSVTQMVAIITAIGLLAKCNTPETVGPNTSLASCSCSCDGTEYDPVCSPDNQLQFFNPCYAGCQGKQQDGDFTNCTCIKLYVDNTNFTSDSAISANSQQDTASPGTCKSDCISTFLPVFLISFFLTMTITFLANIPSLTATLRCVDPSVRSLALGTQWLLIRLLGTIPGPVAMGKMFDNSCAEWAGYDDHCIIYRSEEISRRVLILTVICKSLSIAFFLSGVRWVSVILIHQSQFVAIVRLYKINSEEDEQEGEEKEEKEKEQAK